jgi:hypothetical protein
VFVATVIVSVVLAALLALSAARKLTHQQRFVQGYLRVGVPENKLDYLAMILLAGAVGLLVGLAWAPIGVVAAAGVVCYFVVAIAFHIRADDERNLPTPVAFEAIAVAALALRLTTM